LQNQLDAERFQVGAAGRDCVKTGDLLYGGANSFHHHGENYHSTNVGE
jgi:hypothetical protein